MEKIYRILLGIFLVCLIPILLVLSYWSCRYSYYGTVDYSIRNLLIKDSTWKHFVIFLLTSVLVYEGDKWLNAQNQEKQEKICIYTLLATSVTAFLLGSIYVLNNPYYPVGDQISATAFAAYCRDGNFIMLCSGGYVGMYQQQKGLGILYEILFALFGNFNYTPAKILHVIWWVLAILAGYGFLKLNTDRAIFRIVYCIMMLGCIPFLLYLPYIYGDVLSISFGMVMFWAVSAYEHYEKKRYIALAACVAGIAVLARKNTWIILIGVGIYAVLVCLKKKKGQYLLAGFAILLTAALTVKAVDVMYEYRSGYPSDIGIPSILWIAMGLQETDGMAGVYNRYQQTTFAEHDFQQEPAAQEGKEYIRERLREFRENPAMARDFFKRKLEDQWIEPLFSSLKATESFDTDGEPLSSGITSLYYGNIHETVWKLANYYQSIVYLAGLVLGIALCGRWWQKKEIPTALWLPLIGIVGGFLFSIIWEAQSRYVFPYYVFLILFVPMGLYETGRAISRLPKHRRKQPNRTRHRKKAYERSPDAFLAAFSCLFRMRSSSKKVFSIWLHSVSRMPRVTFT